MYTISFTRQNGKRYTKSFQTYNRMQQWIDANKDTVSNVKVW